LFQRQLFRTKTESVIDTINILTKISDSPSLITCKSSFSKNSLDNRYYTSPPEVRQPLRLVNIRSSLASSADKQNLNEDLLILPKWSFSPQKNSNQIKNSKNASPTSDFELPSVDDKRFIYSLKKKLCKKRLRNLLDNGIESKSESSKISKKINAVINDAENSNEFLFTKVGTDKQLKQIESYKKFKAELGFSFSRRLPITSIKSVPNFLIRPKKIE
jgi:hypothetical protein